MLINESLKLKMRKIFIFRKFDSNVRSNDCFTIAHTNRTNEKLILFFKNANPIHPI